MKVIGTAGHIDHGKSTLVQRLTGIDPDRLEEEKRRGMTIDLGFAWLTMPSGNDVSIVDVPGHERFVANMLAGAAGIDVALLVVAADESVMPQTREHLDILDLLEVDRAVVALTKRDLVDDEILELVAQETQEVLDGTRLAGSAVIPVSAVTGEGIPELLLALDSALSNTPDRRDVGLPYVPIDRAFTIDGFGTVVTGTLHDGALHTAQEVELLPSGARSRIRSMQTHRRRIQTAEPGARVAINLPNVERAAISRGDVVAPIDTAVATRRFDAHLRVVGDAPFPLRHGSQVVLHVGAAERPAALVLLDGEAIEPGHGAWVQIRLDEPVVALPGQRFIVRLPAPARTVGGGRVVDAAPRHRRHSTAIVRLRNLSSADPLVTVEAALRAPRPRSTRDLARQVRLAPIELQECLETLVRTARAVAIGGLHWHTDDWHALGTRVAGILSAFHDSQPLRKGMPKEALRSRLKWPADGWPALLRSLAETGILRDDGPSVALPGYHGGSGQRAEEAERVLAQLGGSVAPLSGKDLLTATGADPHLLAALVDEGKAVKVGDDSYLSRAMYGSIVGRVLEVIDRDGQVTAASLRDALSTSRKFAVSLLEHLDSERITRRVGDARTRGSKAPTCA